MSLAIPNATASSKSTTSIANRSLAGASMNSFYKGQPTTVPINNARLSISKNQINTNNECSTKLLDFLLITKKLHKSCIYYSILATSQLGIIIFSIYLMLNNDTLKTFDLDYGGHTWLIVNFILLLGTLLDLPIKFSRRVFLKLKNLFTAKTVALERFEAIYHFYHFIFLSIITSAIALQYMLLSNEWYVQKLRCMEACATSADECLQVKGDLFRFTNTKVFFQDLLLKDSTFTSNNLNCTISNIEKWQNDMKMLDLLAYPVLTLTFINGLVVHTVSSNLIDHISLGNIFQSNTSKVDIATSKKIMEVNNDKNEVNKLSSRPSNRKLNKLSD